MDDHMTPEGYANFDKEECTSLREINPDEVDWRGGSIEACIYECVTEREVEVLSTDDNYDENAVAEGSETIVSVISCSEALILLDKLAYMDWMFSEDIDIWFLLREKSRN